MNAGRSVKWAAVEAHDGWVPLARVAEEFGLTPRQVDFWRTSDYIETEYRHWDGTELDDPAAAGSGYPSFVSPAERERIGVMSTLVRMGSTPSKAALLADRLMADQWLDLGSGVALVRTDATTPPTDTASAAGGGDRG